MEMPFEEPVCCNETGSLLSRDPPVAVAYSVILSVAALVGTLGNTLVIVVVLTGTAKGLIGQEFFVNLAVADLIVTALINPFSVVGVVEGKEFFADKYWLCKTLASICIISCFSSLVNIGLISVSRYVYVCHNSSYRGVYTRRNSLVMCSLAWITGFLLDLPSHVGWSRHYFDEKTHKCLWDRNYTYSYSVFFLVVAIIFNLVIFSMIVIFYLRIIIHVGRAKYQIRSNNTSSALRKTLKQARVVVLIFIAYSVCWFPYIVILLADRDDEYPMKVYLFSSLFAHIHASLNFAIYGLANQRFRQAYVRFLQRYILRSANCCREPKEILVDEMALENVSSTKTTTDDIN